MNYQTTPSWGYWNQCYAKLKIRARGYRMVSMAKALPTVDSVADLTAHKNGALLWLDPRQSFHDLAPPKVALGEEAAYVLDFYRKTEFPPRWDRPFIAYFRNPSLYGRHFSIIDSRRRAFTDCIRMERRWTAGIPQRGEEKTRRHVPGTYLQTCSALHTEFFHHFCDIVPRLMLYEQQGLLNHVPALLHKDKKSYTEASFEMLGLVTDEARYWDNTYWQMDGLYFASPVKQFTSWTPETAAWIRQKFSPGIEQKPPGQKLFYISRRNSIRPALNEPEILEALKPWGITVVEPERLTLKEQIALFADAGLIMGPQGAGIQNALWAPRGCKVLEFLSPVYFSGVFWTLAEALGQPYGFVTGQTSLLENQMAVGSTYDPHLINQALERLTK
jgi:capsular polysaccharide biosynthesis protein